MPALWGFKKNGEYKVTYKHINTNPGTFGVEVLKFIMEIDEKRMNEIFDKIQLVAPEEVSEMISTGVVMREEFELAAYPRHAINPIPLKGGMRYETQYKPSQYKQDDVVYMLDNQEMMNQSKYIVFAYIINLDKNTFELWVENFVPTKAAPKDKGHGFPVRLGGSYSLDTVRKSSIEKMMKKFKSVPVAYSYAYQYLYKNQLQGGVTVQNLLGIQRWLQKKVTADGNQHLLNEREQTAGRIAMMLGMSIGGKAV